MQNDYTTVSHHAPLCAPKRGTTRPTDIGEIVLEL
jgi:hypothetical protein